MWQGKTPARKNLEFILARVGLARKKLKFSSPGPVSPRQNVQIIAKSTNSLPKYTNEPIPRHGEKKVKIFLAGKGLVRKKFKFSSLGQSWRGKIWFSDPRNYCHTPPRPTIPGKRLSQE